MDYWKSQPNLHKEHNFIEIPEGSHRVQITNVDRQVFSKSKKRCYEITLKVSGQHGLLWYYLWYDPNDMLRTDKKFSEFYDSFQIKNRSTRSYKKWIGSMGAVYVNHDYEKRDNCEYEYEYAVKVGFCLKPKQQVALPPWRDASVEQEEIPPVASVELPFI